MAHTTLIPAHLHGLRKYLREMLEDTAWPELARHTPQITAYLDGAGWPEEKHVAMVVLVRRWATWKEQRL